MKGSLTSLPRPPSSVLRLPIRWRLTLWYAALLALILVLFGTIIFLGLRERLYASFDEMLLDQAALALATIRVEDGSPTLASGAQNGEFFLRLIDADGHVITGRDRRFGDVPLNRAAVAAALGGESRFDLVNATGAQDVGDFMDETDPGNEVDQGTQPSHDQIALRIVTLPVRLGEAGAPIGVLQVALDRDDINDALSQLLTVLALAGPLALFVAAFGGYILAGRALAPVTAITALASRVGGSDLHARLNLDLPDDELGRLARTFDAMLARIDDAFTRQRRFTGDAAHELRTPLSLMRSQVDLALARPRTSAEYREALRGFDGDLARLTHLVGTLLTLARADAGRLDPELASFDLAETIQATLEQYAPLAEAAGIGLQNEAAPATLVADEDLLVQLLVNLLDNALAYTPCGGTIAVGCRRENGQAQLWVADSGEGIAAEHHARVFDRFYRVDAARSRARGGTGLGLAICQAIAEAHDGTIALSSEVGHGTRIDVVLPTTLEPHREFMPAS